MNAMISRSRTLDGQEVSEALWKQGKGSNFRGRAATKETQNGHPVESGHEEQTRHLMAVRPGPSNRSAYPSNTSHSPKRLR